LFDILNPILAAIFIPFFTLQFLTRILKESHFSLAIIGSLGFMVFPSFFAFATTNSNYLGGIFLYGTMFLIFAWLYPLKTSGFVIVPIIASFLATFLISPITGVYALSLILLALVVKFHSGSIWKSFTRLRLRTVLVLLFFVLLSLLPMIFLVYGSYLIELSGVVIPSLASVKSFLPLSDVGSFFVPFWLQDFITLNAIIGTGYNFIRLFIVGLGLFLVTQFVKNNDQKVWLSLSAVSFFFAWFSVAVFLQDLALDPYRFAFILDLSLLPMVGLIFYCLFVKILSNKEKVRVGLLEK